MAKSRLSHQYRGNPVKNHPQSPVKEPVFFTSARVLVGALIGYSGLVIGNCPDNFLGHLQNSWHLPLFLSSPIGELFPWLLLGTGLMVLTRFQRPETARMFCGLILACASLDKIGDPSQFSHSVENYKLLPPMLVPLAAVVIPWLEFFTGLCLVIGYQQRGAALIFCTLMGVYGFSLGWDLVQNVDLNCSCFSMDCKEKMSWWTVVRDMFFLRTGLIVLMIQNTRSLLDPFFPPKPSK
jgi:uncharacterized membrane protein YphA (DoxX/SURF4 family)